MTLFSVVKQSINALRGANGRVGAPSWLKGGLIDEYQLGRIEIGLAAEPGATASQDIRAVLLQCTCGLF